MMRAEFCERCKHYKMIDSGYGNCLESPPQPVMREKKVSWEYPCIAWNREVCGRYESRPEFREEETHIHIRR